MTSSFKVHLHSVVFISVNFITLLYVPVVKASTPVDTILMEKKAFAVEICNFRWFQQFPVVWGGNLLSLNK